MVLGDRISARATRSNANVPRITMAPRSAGLPIRGRSQFARSRGEQLPGDVGEGFELQGVACGVEQEHCRLFAGFAGEAGVGGDDKLDARRREMVGEPLPLVHGQHDAEVGHGHAMAVDGVVVRREFARRPQLGVEVAHELMAEQVEVDPAVGRAALGAAEQFAVELAGLGDVAHLHGNVKRREL